MIIAGTVLFGFTPAIFCCCCCCHFPTKSLNMLRKERFLEVVEQVQFSIINKTFVIILNPES